AGPLIVVCRRRSTMSLPLTRRIARAALIVAAGAAAGVGAAGSASAAPQLPAAPNLGLNALDGATGNTVDNVAKGVGKTAPRTKEGSRAAGTTGRKAAPGVMQCPSDSLWKGGGVPAVKNLPVEAMPSGSAPGPCGVQGDGVRGCFPEPGRPFRRSCGG